MQIRVFAIGDHRVARIDGQGCAMPPPHWLGLRAETDEKGAVKYVPIEEGSLVEDHGHYRRAAKRGECRIEEVAP